MQGVGCLASGAGFGVPGLGVQGAGFGVPGLGLGVQGAGFTVKTARSMGTEHQPSQLAQTPQLVQVKDTGLRCPTPQTSPLTILLFFFITLDLELSDTKVYEP